MCAPLERRVPTDPQRQWPWEGLIRHGYVVPLRATAETHLGGTEARSRRRLHTVTLWCMLVTSVAVPVAAFATGLVRIAEAPVVGEPVSVRTEVPDNDLHDCRHPSSRISSLYRRFTPPCRIGTIL
ncbi:hypothetical protein Y013_02585 [Rhodococcus pyridinivorans SB3094]|uniref:Uncharacterized protein n=1 Tax=Rhodococcus pyridinivorans SB3094 TaxID=1435356 RepID=V9XQC8_9NOCA|nr:hypothetical protein Y013_02585 [Rhodococcus pyridinivorans SB3094]